MNQHAQELFCTLRERFTSRHQKASFSALVALFLKGDGGAYLCHCSSKSPSALSRFLNHYAWNTRAVIRTTRQHANTHKKACSRTISNSGDVDRACW